MCTIASNTFLKATWFCLTLEFQKKKRQRREQQLGEGVRELAFFIPAFLDTNQKSKSREVEGGKGSERGSRSVVRPVCSHTKTHPTRTPFWGSSSLFFPPNAQANTNQNKQGEEGERKTRTTKTKPNPERAQASKRARARPLGRGARATAPGFGFLSPPAPHLQPPQPHPAPRLC